ncbi:MAG TPA: hypothetical protein VGI40_26935 [Pirellulaceae bacterium]|jgi:hypothetical protein
MLRFTIRDLLWLTVVVALLLGMWHQRRDYLQRLDIAHRHAAAVRLEVLKAQSNEQEYASHIDPIVLEPHLAEVDWEVATQDVP